VRIVIVDDHPMVREALAIHVSLVLDFAVCGQASTTQDAMKQVADLAPDLVLVEACETPSNCSARPCGGGSATKARIRRRSFGAYLLLFALVTLL